MFLHFVPDNGFLNYFIKLTEEICGKGNNRYVIPEGPTPISQPTRKRINFDFVTPVRYGSNEFYKHIGNVNDYEKVFIHFLSDSACDFILKHRDSNIKFYWLFWGADLYKPLNKFAPLIYDEDSLKFYKSHTTYNKTGNAFLDFLKYSKRTLLGGYYEKKSYELRSAAIQRINFFCHYNPLDLDLLNQYYPTKAKYTSFFYFEYDYSVLQNVDESVVSKIRSKLNLKANTIVQVGHSASLSNNHFSVLQQLKESSLTDIQIVCPLSYGDFRYGKEVAALGHQLFDDAFIPLTQYLSKEEYQGLLSCIDISVMNHKRTEAAGNVFMMLAMEKKVYLNSTSNLFSYLRNNNEKVFEIGKDEFAATFDSTERTKNKDIITDIFSINRARLNLEHLYSNPA